MLEPNYPDQAWADSKFLGCIGSADIWVDREGPIVQFGPHAMDFIFFTERYVAAYDRTTRGWYDARLKRVEDPGPEHRVLAEQALNFVRLYNDGSLTLRETD